MSFVYLILTNILLIYSKFSLFAQSSEHNVISEHSIKIDEEILKTSQIIDGHNDLFIHYFECKDCPKDIVDYPLDNITKGHTDIIRWRKGGVGGQLLNVFGGMKTLDDYLKAWDLLYRLEEKYKNDLTVVGSSSEMRHVMNEGKIAILPSLEGSVRLGDNMFLVRSFYKLGLRSVTFAYYTNQFADGSNDTVKFNGISKLGEEMVKEMNRLGIIIDMSHISAEAMNDILDITKAPVIFSHSNARALCNVNRNVPDDVLLRLKENNGLIMLTAVPYFTRKDHYEWMDRGDTLYYKIIKEFPDNKAKVDSIMEKWEREDIMPEVTVKDFADHFDHVKNLIGVDHIGISGDYDGIYYTIKGMEDVSTYPNLLIELVNRGWTEEEIRKICSENFLRVFENIEKVSANLKLETQPSLMNLSETK
ncbi:MAG: dipeptidase [Melioribacteraceae bacterium]